MHCYQPLPNLIRRKPKMVNTYKIHLFRYVYRFVCDLQSLLGYSPEELHAMVDLQSAPSAAAATPPASSLDLGGHGIKKEND